MTRSHRRYHVMFFAGREPFIDTLQLTITDLLTYDLFKNILIKFLLNITEGHIYLSLE